MTDHLLEVLQARGMTALSTDTHLRDRLAQPLTAYIGFDPTADSLHVGSLLQIMTLAWLQRCGHRPIALVGGATGLIGDPSGKTDQRKMMTLEQTAANAAAIGRQLGRFLDFGAGQASLVNNADWFASRGWIEFLREIGPHFSVNRMLTMDSVKSRLGSESGLSFLEFNYMILQAYDYLHLHRTQGCTLQMGGQDQLGNIIMGIELVRRLAGAEVAGLTTPLVTKADGSKFGKTESGSVWLDAARTPIHDFYQFWRNTPDAMVGKYLGFFTFLTLDEVDRLGALRDRACNEAKEVLAFEVTRQVHGEAAALQAQSEARRAFGAAHDVSGDLIPHASLTRAELEAGLGLIALLVRAGLASSNGEARRLIVGGGVRLFEAAIDDPSRALTPADAKDDHLLLRVGKKRMFRYDLT